jgi:hypothetical protein
MRMLKLVVHVSYTGIFQNFPHRSDQHSYSFRTGLRTLPTSMSLHLLDYPYLPLCKIRHYRVGVESDSGRYVSLKHVATIEHTW